jgi:hypothetical protein
MLSDEDRAWLAPGELAKYETDPARWASAARTLAAQRRERGEPRAPDEADAYARVRACSDRNLSCPGPRCRRDGRRVRLDDCLACVRGN